MHGMQLGATGLAAKMVLVQYLGVNVQLWFNTKYLKLPFLNYFLHQIYTMLILGTTSCISMKFADFFSDNILISFLMSGFIYSIVVAMIVYSFPSIISFNRNELTKLIIDGKNKIFRNWWKRRRCYKRYAKLDRPN